MGKNFRNALPVMKKKRFGVAFVLTLCLIILPPTNLVQAQVPGMPNLPTPLPTFIGNSVNGSSVSGCIRLDGRCVTQIAANRGELFSRINEVERRLYQISQDYFGQDSAQLNVRSEPSDSVRDIYVAIDQNEIRLMSVTYQDASLNGMTIEQRADQMVRTIERAIERAKRERKPSFLIRQGVISAIALSIILVLTLIGLQLEKRFRQQKQYLHTDPAISSRQLAISTQLTQKQKGQVAEIKHRAMQVILFSLWMGGFFYIIGLFPYTRFVQVIIYTLFRIPIRVGFVILIVYFLVRFSFVLVDKLTGALANNSLLTPEANLRLQLRISTISSVTKSVLILGYIILGTLVSLSLIGVDIGPLLAGAGLIGLAISFASQNLIQDAINGFLIILEDQYAVGDFIGIGQSAGIVEDINLRITRLRDTEGRLVTIPNSEVRTVTNYTSNWSQADIKIPIAYQTDVEQALQIVENINNQISQEWQQEILEKPKLLGVDEFSNQGVIIRIWIKTKPMQQWPIAREYRRQVKAAFDKAGIELALPHQKIWISHHNEEGRKEV